MSYNLPMTKISLSLNDDDIKRLDKQREANGLTRYAYALKLVRDGGMKQKDPERILASEPVVDFKMVETNFTMPDFLKKTVVARAKAAGMKTSPYIAALLQAHTLRKPVLRHNELQAILQSQRELAAIGRNLNQVARALNERFSETDRLKLGMINDLKVAIDKQQKTISDVVRASLRSWGVDE